MIYFLNSLLYIIIDIFFVTLLYITICIISLTHNSPLSSTGIICKYPQNKNPRVVIYSKLGVVNYVNTTASVTCTMFSDRIGPDNMVCQKDGTWSNSDTYCLKSK